MFSNNKEKENITKIKKITSLINSIVYKKKKKKNSLPIAYWCLCCSIVKAILSLRERDLILIVVVVGIYLMVSGSGIHLH